MSQEREEKDIEKLSPSILSINNELFSVEGRMVVLNIV